MRSALAIVALLAACDSKQSEAPVAKPKLAVVTVANANALAIDDGKPPPPIVIVDDPSPLAPGEDIHAMKVRSTSAATWAEVATTAALERATPTTIATVDVDEPKPDALEEGDMAKREPDDYHGKVRPPKPRTAGRRGPQTFEKDADTPTRLANVVGEVMEGKLGPQRIAVIASPKTNAQRLALVLRETAGVLVVDHAGTLRPLRIDFTEAWLASDEASFWIEARVSAGGVVAVEAVSETPIEVRDLGQLAAAIEKARTSRKLGVNAPVDVLFDPAIDAQRLVDMLIALDAAKVKFVGLGAMPDGEDMARRGRRIPTMSIATPDVMGERDKLYVERVFRESKPKLYACYLKSPELEGRLSVRFFILPTGKLGGEVFVEGIDNPDFANCMREVVKQLEWSPNKGGGGVQVGFTLILRP